MQPAARRRRPPPASLRVAAEDAPLLAAAVARYGTRSAALRAGLRALDLRAAADLEAAALDALDAAPVRPDRAAALEAALLDLDTPPARRPYAPEVPG